MAGSIDGAECPHGVNVFDPRGCAACTAEMNSKKPITNANGHVPRGLRFGKQKEDGDGKED